MADSHPMMVQRHQALRLFTRHGLAAICSSEVARHTCLGKLELWRPLKKKIQWWTSSQAEVRVKHRRLRLEPWPPFMMIESILPSLLENVRMAHSSTHSALAVRLEAENVRQIWPEMQCKSRDVAAPLARIPVSCRSSIIHLSYRLGGVTGVRVLHNFVTRLRLG
jgi:hypothetical protein